MPKYSVLFARFPFLNQECPDVTDWLLRTCDKARRDPRIDQVHHVRFDDTPVTMTRNRMIEHAKKLNVDLLCMVDSDMCPDCERDGKPFWDTSLDFILSHTGGPCVVAAPYCGPPPQCCVYIFRWANWVNDPYWPDVRQEMYTREEAAIRLGFERVSALPTGLMLLDMRAIAKLKPPYFYYEWRNNYTEKASTEDVTFTRDMALIGSVPIYVNWDAWAGHWKRYLVKKPKAIFVEDVQDKYVEAVKQELSRRRKLVMVGEGQGPSVDESLVLTGEQLAKRNGAPVNDRTVSVG